MFCAVSHYQTQDIDGLVRFFKDKYVPVMAEENGCKGIEVLTKPDTGELVLLKFWDTEEHSAAWLESSAHKQFHPLITPFLIGDRTHNYYEVQVRTVEKS